MNLKIGKFTKKALPLLLIGCLIPLSSNALSTYSTRYYPDSNHWINTDSASRYNNRPIYINNTDAFILAGEKPLIRLAKGNEMFGVFQLTINDGNKKIRVDSLHNIKASYHAGEMKWEIHDPILKGGAIILHTFPSANDLGMILTMETKRIAKNLKFTWSFSGAKIYGKDVHLSWDFDAVGHPEMFKWGAENAPIADEKQIAIQGNGVKYWHIAIDGEKVKIEEDGQAMASFKQSREQLDNKQSRMVIDTPDPYLNSVADASLNAVDGTWHDPVFVHGCMQWNVALPGWRTIFGGTMYGWHDRVEKEGQYYIGSQVTESDNVSAKLDPNTQYTEQSSDSRFYGVGHIQKDQSFYNMQSQFFDQMIEEYRWTGNHEFARILLPALERHLKWQQECFDPDEDGIYESYLNSWPTDSQWYNGGGTAEETSYAYRGHLAARDMARAANDWKAVAYHDSILSRIHDGFFKKLWISSKGHSGAYLESGGYKRLHENPWIYSIFLPIDANLTNATQNFESLYYSESELQNDNNPAGGRRVWASNWVPGIWSVRELWPGDNYHLALAYFKSGMADDGWDVMRGNFMNTAFDNSVPGDLGSYQGGVDFGDCVHPFSRALVSGMFGFNPDYPNGEVTFAPQFPTDWNHASIKLPDFSLSYRRSSNKLDYNFAITKVAKMKIRIPVSCSNIDEVQVNGKSTTWTIEPNAGYGMLCLTVPAENKADVKIRLHDALKPLPIVKKECVTGETVDFSYNGVNIDSVLDPQKAASAAEIKNGCAKIIIGNNSGSHSIFLHAKRGAVPLWIVGRLSIKDPIREKNEQARYYTDFPINTKWKTIDMESLKNADVRTIYKQKYLSPRPNTVSACLGDDGYSSWTFHHWNTGAPEIGLENISKLQDGENQIRVTSNVPFQWSAKSKNNILFTSLWDNYPDESTIPINDSGKAICFLVCGSTNVMQCSIANGALEVHYSDGSVTTLNLTPPVNYWNLSPIDPQTPLADQRSRTYYTAEIDKFCMPKTLPKTVELGKNCTAMVLNLRLDPQKKVDHVVLKTLSQEVVVGLMGITLMK